MAEIIHCPQCQRRVQVPEELAGQQVKCPSCAAVFTAELAEQAPPGAVREDPPRPAPPTYELAHDEPPAAGPDDFRDPKPRRRRVRRDCAPHRGVAILVLGICSLIVCALCGPFAWVMGNNDMAEIRAGRMDPEGEGMTQAGRVLGIISTVLMIAACVFYALLFGVLGLGGALK